MECLPLEIFEYISRFLSHKDLSRCCAVCKLWHQMFGDNTIWRRRCDFKLSEYLEKASSIVEPHFASPQDGGNDLMPIGQWRLNFLRQQHCLSNWRAGRYKREEIEFDFDDSISYNIKVECLGNDHVCLHTTFETQVWSILQEPNLVVTVPFKLVELWETNLYKVVEKKLIIVQCNVVQIFDICIASKTWSFDRAFFFDASEEFSSNITKDTDINKMFKETSSDIGENLERVIVGNFLIGIITTRLALQDPVMHIWELGTWKKIKEEHILEHFGSDIFNVSFETYESSNDILVVTYRTRNSKGFTAYSLTKLESIATFNCENGDSIICDNHFYVCTAFQSLILKYDPLTKVIERVHSFEQGRLNCWDIICNKIVAANANDLVLLNPVNQKVEIRLCVDFPLGDFKVVKDKYLALHDKEGNLKQVLEMVQRDQSTKNKEFAFLKCFSLPTDFGTYRTTNEVCTKIVLERANKLIILNFW